jgi:hypothetical protein
MLMFLSHMRILHDENSRSRYIFDDVIPTSDKTTGAFTSVAWSSPEPEVTETRDTKNVKVFECEVLSGGV